MLGVENDEVKLGKSQQLGDAGCRPGEETAEKRVTFKNPAAEVRSFQLSVLSFQFSNQGSRHFLNFFDLT